MSRDLVLAEAIEAIKESLRRADNAYCYSHELDPEEVAATINYHVERAFVQTLVLAEGVGLHKIYDKIDNLYQQAKEQGFAKQEMGAYDPYLLWPEVLGNYLDAIGTNLKTCLSSGTVIKDLESIVRESLYSITDSKVFPQSPADESELHAREEAVLRCIFPDLRHKPVLAKPIKNFEPDTGLPSIRTLIEYKFIADKQGAKRIVEEILADTRGYISKDWDTFIYVIYETRRLISETQWNSLLVGCDVENTKIIVLSGETPKERVHRAGTYQRLRPNKAQGPEEKDE